jgi:excinuclease ABC subunit A
MVKFSEEEIVSNIFQKFPNKKISVLSPLVRGRKGHYRELFEDIRKKGFVKVRIDGEIRDLVPKMQVDRYKIHDIEVVIDRLTVTTEMKTRVSQSVQTALNMGKGMMFLLLNDDDKIVKYRKQLMCDETGISYEEPSPNSFHSTHRMVPAPFVKDWAQSTGSAWMPLFRTEKSVNEGGIEPLGSERDAYTFTAVQKLARKNKFSLDTPIEDMPAKALNLILYGTTEIL